MGTGHLPDITVAKPIFLDGRIVGFAGSVAHAPDIGGKIRSADASEVFEEGLQIPVMKVMRRGKIDATFERILRKNVRVPDQVMGDLYAQFTGLHLMEQRVLTLMQEQKLDSLEALADEIHARSEAAMRAAIRALPDGVYTNTAVSDGFAEPIKLEMKMTVSGDTIAIDFAGSAPQVLRSINVCLAYTIAYTAFGVKAVLAPDVPNNDGVLRPITITAPAGSILNSTPPAAGGARALIGHFLPMMVISALAKAMPERVIATVGSPLWCINLAGVNPGGRQELREPLLHERRLRRRARPRRRQRAVVAEQHFLDAGRDDRAARAAESAASQAPRRPAPAAKDASAAATGRRSCSRRLRKAPSSRRFSPSARAPKLRRGASPAAQPARPARC